MARLGPAIRAELLKLARYRLAWGLLAAMLAIALLGVRADLRRAQEVAPAPEEITPLTVLPAEYAQRVTLPGTLERVPAGFELPAVFALLLALIVAGNDFQWGSVRPVLCRMPARGQLLAARFVALAAGSALLVLALWLARGLAALPAGRALGGLDFAFLDGRFLLGQAAGLLRTWLATWPAIAFGLLVAVWVRNVPLSITLGGMAYFLGWMALMLALAFLPIVMRAEIEAGRDLGSLDLGLWGLLPTLSPHYNMAAVANWGNPAGMAQDPSLTLVALLEMALPHNPWRGLGLLALYSLLFLALARQAFWGQDVTR